MSTGDITRIRKSKNWVYDISDAISTKEYRKYKVKAMVFKNNEGEPIYYE